MILNFNRDAQAAASAEGSPTITESGKYIVTILEADTYSRTYNGKSYQLVRLLVESSQKLRQTIELIVDGGEGDWNLRLFHSMLTCIGVETVNFQPASVTPHYRGRLDDQKKEQGYRSRELEKKRVGVIFQKSLRNYIDQHGETKETFDMRPIRFFDAETEQTASEKMRGADPVGIANVLSKLEDKDNRTQQAQPAKAVTKVDSGFDDSVPF